MIFFSLLGVSLYFSGHVTAARWALVMNLSPGYEEMCQRSISKINAPRVEFCGSLRMFSLSFWAVCESGMYM